MDEQLQLYVVVFFGAKITILDVRGLGATPVAANALDVAFSIITRSSRASFRHDSEAGESESRSSAGCRCGLARRARDAVAEEGRERNERPRSFIENSGEGSISFPRRPAPSAWPYGDKDEAPGGKSVAACLGSRSTWADARTVEPPLGCSNCKGCGIRSVARPS